MEPELRLQLETTRPWCRPHALAETFSTLTGGRLGFRMDPDDAAKLIAGFADHLRFVELAAEETLAALASAKSLGIRGGRVHDFLHAVAARKAGCTTLLTLNIADFLEIDSNLSTESP
jgi:predicted nucleic acid-binding protein